MGKYIKGGGPVEKVVPQDLQGLAWIFCFRKNSLYSLDKSLQDFVQLTALLYISAIFIIRSEGAWMPWWQGPHILPKTNCPNEVGNQMGVLYGNDCDLCYLSMFLQTPKKSACNASATAFHTEQHELDPGKAVFILIPLQSAGHRGISTACGFTKKGRQPRGRGVMPTSGTW